MAIMMQQQQLKFPGTISTQLHSKRSWPSRLSTQTPLFAFTEPPPPTPQINREGEKIENFTRREIVEILDCREDDTCAHAVCIERRGDIVTLFGVMLLLVNRTFSLSISTEMNVYICCRSETVTRWIYKRRQHRVRDFLGYELKLNWHSLSHLPKSVENGDIAINNNRHISIVIIKVVYSTHLSILLIYSWSHFSCLF
jgi:hypothetical protein